MTSPGASVVHKLVPGATATLRIAGELARRSQEFLSTDRVMLFHDDPGSEDAETFDVPFRDGTGTFGGFKPGKHSLWFDFPPWAPLILHDARR